MSATIRSIGPYEYRWVCGRCDYSTPYVPDDMATLDALIDAHNAEHHAADTVTITISRHDADEFAHACDSTPWQGFCDYCHWGLTERTHLDECAMRRLSVACAGALAADIGSHT